MGKMIETDRYGRITVYRTLDEPMRKGVCRTIKAIISRLIRKN